MSADVADVRFIDAREEALIETDTTEVPSDQDEAEPDVRETRAASLCATHQIASTTDGPGGVSVGCFEDKVEGDGAF